MNTREAMKITLKLIFENLEDEKNLAFSKDKVENAIQIMHDDYTFWQELLDFVEDHLETFGENYDLY